jgi:hypothetical protein
LASMTLLRDLFALPDVLVCSRNVETEVFEVTELVVTAAPPRPRNVNWRLSPARLLELGADVSNSRSLASSSCLSSGACSSASRRYVACSLHRDRASPEGNEGGTRGSRKFRSFLCFFPALSSCLTEPVVSTQSACWCMNRVFPATAPHSELALDSRGRCGTSGPSSIIRLAGRARFISPGYSELPLEGRHPRPRHPSRAISATNGSLCWS